MKKLLIPNRRSLLAGAAGLVASTPLLAATLTPRQTAGPFYPETIPADSDMDLTSFSGGKAQGEVIEVSGRVFSEKGQPLPGTVVELWQANAFGRYDHPEDPATMPLDPNFQGYGSIHTGNDGSWKLTTIKPAAWSQIFSR